MSRTAIAFLSLLLIGGPSPVSGQSSARLVIQRGETSTSVTVLDSRRGPVVRLEETLIPLGAAVIRQGPDRYRLVLGPLNIELQVGLAVATIAGKGEQLPVAPAEFEGSLLVPLALFTDVIPRVSSVYAYDRAAQTLRHAATERLLVAPPAESVTQPPPAATRAAPPPRTDRATDGAAPLKRDNRAAAAAPESNRAPIAPVVVVDAGHGGVDKGMRGPIGSAAKVFEADITLGIAKQLEAELKRQGVDVIMTRSTDTLIALRDRGRIANRAQGKLFISIHVNAANPRWRQPGTARGFETYFLSEAKTDDERRVEELENEAVKYEEEETFSSNDPMSFILNDMKQNEYLRESQDLARTIQQGLASVHPGPNRGVKQAGFRVLVSSFMPSVLVEVGFGSNAQEARYLSSTAGQKEIARALGAAAMKYLEDLHRRNANPARVIP